MSLDANHFLRSRGFRASLLMGGCVIGIACCVYAWIEWPKRTLEELRAVVERGDIAAINTYLVPPSRVERWCEDGFRYHPDFRVEGHYHLTREDLLTVLDGATAAHRRFSDCLAAECQFRLPTAPALQTMVGVEVTPQEGLSSFGGVGLRMGSNAAARLTHGDWELKVVRGRACLVYADGESPKR